MTDYDVIIVGAGVAGMAAASVLASRGLRIAVIERGCSDDLKTGECLMADALPIMERLGLSEGFLADEHRSLQSYQVAWGQEEAHERHLLTSPTGAGWIVDRQRFDRMLLTKCEQEGVTVFWESSLQDIEKTSVDSLQQNCWQLQFNNKSLTAEFVIDTSGRTRAVTRRLGRDKKGIAKQEVDKMAASCCHIQSNSELSAASAIIASDQQGWWYYAKYSTTQASLCYFSDADLPLPDSSENLLSTAKTQPLLAQYLTDAQPITTTFKRHAAYSSALQHCVGDGWLAIGDAAASFDPLSSYGMTSALSGAFYASQALLRYFNNEPEYLETYEQLIQKNFLSYLDNRHQEYAKVENVNSVFWQRRQYTSAA